MAYDQEKYRHKREKVLGLKRRGISFQALAVLVAGCILGGLALAALPGTVTWVTTRNLDDAIYKLKGTQTWPETAMEEIRAIPGVREALMDRHGSRLVITFDRTATDRNRLEMVFHHHQLDAALLNLSNHRNRMSIRHEEETLETP